MTKTTRFSTYIAYDARLFYVLQGEGIINVCGHQQKMKKGSALIINSGVEYTIKSPENSVTYVIFNFDFIYDNCAVNKPVLPAFKNSYQPEKLVSHVEFSDNAGKKLNTFFYIDDAKTIEKKALNIVSEYKQMLFEYDLSNSCQLTEILIELIRIGHIAPSEEGLPRAIIEYINKNYFSDITNESIAVKFGFHPNYLSALVKKTVGMSLHQYLIHIRLLRGAELLETGKFTVGEVAEKTGFCDIYYFSRCFKMKMKETPTEYAKKFRSQ